MCVFCTKAFARFAGRLHGFAPSPADDDARPPLAVDEPQALPSASLQDERAPTRTRRASRISGNAMKSTA
jgi:hypothetical protein